MDKRIEKAYDLISKHYHEKMLLKDLADRVKLSPFHFQRLFKKEMNETPSACLTRIRLERVAHLLNSGTKMTMTELAMANGFNSLSAFTRAFTTRFKVPPSAFVSDRSSTPLVIRIPRNAPPFSVEIVYRPDTYIYYRKTHIYNENLWSEFMEAKAECLKKGFKTGRIVGVMDQVTFHYPTQKMNYSAGVEVLNVDKNFNENILHIPKGKYACFVTDASCQDVQATMMRFKMEWMDKSSYVRRDLISVEEFDESNHNKLYPNLKRKVFVPLLPRKK